MEQYIITKKEAKDNGVNLDMIDICRTIRNLAQTDNISLDESIHKENAYNKHLFSYIEYCGLDVKEYIIKYLSNLQPYMLSEFKSQEKKDTYVCVLDNAYRISLYIKLDKQKGRELIISFHENSKRGIAKENNTIQNYESIRSEIVPVFGEPTGVRIQGSSREEIKVFIQRGMLLLPVLVMAQQCEGKIYLIERGSIETLIIDQCNQYLRDLYTSNVDLNALNNVEIFSVLQQISFTSFGNTIFSNLTLLIDNMEMQRGPASKAAADFTLTTYIDHLYLTNDQAQELISLLDEKYKVKSSRGIDILLTRVKDELNATAIETQKLIEGETINNNMIEDHNIQYIPKDTDESSVTNLSKRTKGR